MAKIATVQSIVFFYEETGQETPWLLHGFKFLYNYIRIHTYEYIRPPELLRTMQY